MQKGDMKNIILKEIVSSKLEKNKGIHEFHIDGIKSLGVSFEDIDGKENVYIYNVFVDSEYIGISGEGTENNILPDEILNKIVEIWNKY